jgi:hypothetical protein
MADLTSLPDSPNILPPRAVNANNFLPDADGEIPMDDAWGDDLVVDTAVTTPLFNDVVDGAIATPSCNDVADRADAAPSCNDLADSAVAVHLWKDATEAAVAAPLRYNVVDAAVAAPSCNDVCLWQCIITTLALVWAVPNMFPTHVDACYRLLHPHQPNHLFVIHRTGAGKTHIMRTLGVVEQGIILIFISLLTLLADIIHKFKCANEEWGSVVIYHLDKIYDLNKRAYE